MEINDNPPCEREWTIAEREEFFASQDARTGLYGTPTNMTPFRPSPYVHYCGDEIAKQFLPEPIGIFVTSIVPPEQGWPIAMYCPICKETTFLLSPWAAKPSDGDYFRMNEVCGSIEYGEIHNFRLAMKPLAVPLALHHRMMFGPYDAIIEHEMTIEEAKKRYPNTPIHGEK